MINPHLELARRSADMADQLRDLARRVRHLLPSRHDPEAFHVAKDEIEQELRLLASQAGGRRPPHESHTARQRRR